MAPGTQTAPGHDQPPTPVNMAKTMWASCWKADRGETVAYA